MEAGLFDLLGGEEIASGAGLLSAVAGRPNCLFLIDELGSLLRAINSKNAGNHERAIIDALMKLFSSAKSVMLGTEYADKRARPRVDILYPNVCLYGTTVPSKFYDNLDADAISGGFLNRLLLVEAPSLPPATRNIAQSSAVPGAIVAWLKAARAIFPGLEDTGKYPLVVPYSPRAETLLTQFEAELQDRGIKMRADPAQAPLADLWARAYEHAVKIALVVACSSEVDVDRLAGAGATNCLEIDGASAQWAIDFVRCAVAHTEAAAATRMGGSDHARRCQEALRCFAKAESGGLTQRELNIASRSFKALQPYVQKEVIEALLLRGDIVGVPGTRTTRYFAAEFAPDEVQTVLSAAQGTGA